MDEGQLSQPLLPLSPQPAHPPGQRYPHPHSVSTVASRSRRVKLDLARCPIQFDPFRTSTTPTLQTSHCTALHGTPLRSCECMRQSREVEEFGDESTNCGPDGNMQGTTETGPPRCSPPTSSPRLTGDACTRPCCPCCRPRPQPRGGPALARRAPEPGPASAPAPCSPPPRTATTHLRSRTGAFPAQPLLPSPMETVGTWTTRYISANSYSSGGPARRWMSSKAPTLGMTSELTPNWASLSTSKYDDLQEGENILFHLYDRYDSRGFFGHTVPP